MRRRARGRHFEEFGKQKICLASCGSLDAKLTTHRQTWVKLCIQICGTGPWLWVFKKKTGLIISQSQPSYIPALWLFKPVCKHMLNFIVTAFTYWAFHNELGQCYHRFGWVASICVNAGKHSAMRISEHNQLGTKKGRCPPPTSESEDRLLHTILKHLSNGTCCL